MAESPLKETRVRGRIIPDNRQARDLDQMELAMEMASAFEEEVENWPEFHRASDMLDEIEARRRRMR
jgi:hypothetical protein